MTPCDILRVKNALVKCIYCVTQHTVRSFVSSLNSVTVRAAHQLRAAANRWRSPLVPRTTAFFVTWRGETPEQAVLCCQVWGPRCIGWTLKPALVLSFLLQEQIVSQNLHRDLAFHSLQVLYGDKLAHAPNSKLQYHPLVGHRRLFSTFHLRTISRGHS